MKYYLELEKIFYRIAQLKHSISFLYWDEAVMMPKGGAESRGLATAELRLLIHEMTASNQTQDLLAQALELRSELNDWQKSNLDRMKFEIYSATAVDGKLVAALSLACSKSENAWNSMRKENNFKDYKPYFKEVLKLVREDAVQKAKKYGLGIYDACLEQHNPGLRSADVQVLFDEVKSFLPNLTEKILEKQNSNKIQGEIRSEATEFNFPIDKQKALGIKVMEIMGFDFDHGRLDISTHPFCGGSTQDVRITTRYKTQNFSDSLMGIIHESGHSLYEQGLPRDWAYQPVGQALGMQMHESQSLFYEMQVARSPEFVNFLTPLFKEAFSDMKLSDSYWKGLYRDLVQVEKSFIRVDADEVTYPMHVILRFEIEQDLISGKLEIDELPEVWNAKMKSYLGLSTLGNDKDGCMQDIHWPSGAFGYFPSYSLGAMTAAQLMGAFKRQNAEWQTQLYTGNLLPLKEWLSKNIWSNGSKIPTNDLLIQATGEKLNPKYFKDHLEQRYLN